MKKILLLFCFVTAATIAFAQPANDNCNTATSLGTLPTPAACPSGIGSAVTTTGTTIGATGANPYTTLLGCQTGGNQPGPALDVWYSFVATGNLITINITPGPAPFLPNPAVTLWSGSCGSLVGMNCANNGTAGGNITATFAPTTPGVTYYLEVSGSTPTAAGNFNLSVNNNNDCNNCNTVSTLTATPAPVNGTYGPGVTVSFCYTITNFTQVSSNWLHGCIPTFGCGWDLATITHTPATSCSGSGTWGWYNSCTSSANGSTTGPGFYYETSAGSACACVNGNPGDNFGDNNVTGSCSWTFCWTIKTKATCACNNLNITINTTGDGESGSWSSIACQGDPDYHFAATMNCCSVTTTQTNVSCFGGNNGSATATSTGQAPFTYSWNPTGQTTATATNLPAGTYTVTSTDNVGCVSTATVTITQPTQLTATSTMTPATCGGNNGTATATPAGGTGPYTYSWSPGGQTTATATNLTAGSYTCTVTDSHGCTTTTIVNVTTTGGITASITASSNVLCFGGNTGSATATPSGGTAPYTYSWNPTGQTTQTATNLTAGSYTCTVTDANGCVGTASITITQPTALTNTSAQTNVTCNGGCNGSATVTPSGGTAPYTYSWSCNAQTTATSTNLCAGTCTCTVHDANGCVITQSFTITQPAALTATSSFVPSTCGNNNGSATVTPAGGTGAYTYSWNPTGQTTATAINLGPNTYSCTITDNNGCSIVVTVTVTNTGGPTATLSAFTNVTCFGACNGTANVTVAGGTAPYTYSWTPSGGNAANATGLCPNTYTCAVTDNNGCTTTATVTITQPTQLTSTTSQTNVTCNGGCNGSATVNPSGGTAPYTYSWSCNAQTTATATNLCAGACNCTITDANGCTLVENFTITEPAALTLAIAGFNVTCNGACDGQVVVIPNGGTGNYTFSWNTGCTTPSCSNVCAGSYTCTVTDANGCTATANTTVTQPTAISITTNEVDAHCNQSDGSASATANGGTGTLTYSWSGGPVSQNYNNIAPGTYTVIVTDQNGCADTATVTVNNISGVTTSVVSQTNVTCFGACDGTITCAAPVTGTPPYTYSWSPVGGNGLTASNLCPGTYTFTATDAAGCSATVTATITQPTQVTVTATATPPAICAGQNSQLSANGNGGTGPYTYLWNPGALVGQNQNVTPAVTTTYTVYVTDAHNCLDSSTVTVTVNGVPVALLSGDTLTGCAPHCVNFTDNSTVNPGVIISWAWDFGDGNTSTLQNPSHCYTTPGQYTVILTVTTNSGCTNTVTMNNYVNIFPNPVAGFSASPQPTTALNPVITFTDLSTGATTWLWDFGNFPDSSSTQQNPVFNYDTAGCYTVLQTVTSINGCVDTAMKIVCIDPDITIYVPNAFTPNGDGVNDIFMPQGIGIDPTHFEMWIFDRWGNMIYYTNDLNKGWDGKVQGHPNLCQQDVYVWKIKCLDVKGGKHNLIGHVSLIR